MNKYEAYGLGAATVVSLMVATGALTYAIATNGTVPIAMTQPYPLPYIAPQQQQYQAKQLPPPERQIARPDPVPYQSQLFAAEKTVPAAASKPMSISPELQASASQILSIVSKLEGASSEAGRNEDNAALPAIQIFFDPRCPYCHKLYAAIDGRAPIHWIPVSALSPQEGGIAYGAAIIQAENDRPGVGGTEALRAAFDKSLTTGNPTDAQKASLDQNLGSFAQLVKTLPPTVQAGVPFALIPKRDGTFETHVGYGEGDEDAILNAYGK